MDFEAFIKVASRYRLGRLVTEQPHPETGGLAELAQSDLYAAIEAMHRVDKLAMGRLGERLAPLDDLVSAVRRTLARGGRVYLAGCGATGRLSLALETIAREAWLEPAGADRVVGFMAGGDTALIRSLESFEDFPEYGERQLLELGFGRRDLLLAITEGGETPFVIGACLKGAEISEEPPWFLHCNPPDALAATVERSRRVLEHPSVKAFCLETGPMALAGSTRLQAATVLMLTAGAALSEATGNQPAISLIAEFRDWINGLDPGFLAPFIEAEANIYAAGDTVLYQTDNYGISVLTDTTERSPTFSLAPFENRDSPGEPASWCYLSLPQCGDARTAWNHLLGREPRSLSWPSLISRAGRERLLGYDISAKAADWRGARCPGCRQYPYRVHSPGLRLDFAGFSHSPGMSGCSPLLRHLVLKCLLNIQSTLVMGRLGRFESNLMTRVRPGNYKLVDRAARYRQYKYTRETGGELSYREAVAAVFRDLEKA